MSLCFVVCCLRVLCVFSECLAVPSYVSVYVGEAINSQYRPGKNIHVQWNLTMTVAYKLKFVVFYRDNYAT